MTLWLRASRTVRRNKMLQAQVVATMAMTIADHSLPSEIGYVSALYVGSFRRQPTPPQ